MICPWYHLCTKNRDDTKTQDYLLIDLLSQDSSMNKIVKWFSMAAKRIPGEYNKYLNASRVPGIVLGNSG